MNWLCFSIKIQVFRHENFHRQNFTVNFHSDCDVKPVSDCRGTSAPIIKSQTIWNEISARLVRCVSRKNVHTLGPTHRRGTIFLSAVQNLLLVAPAAAIYSNYNCFLSQALALSFVLRVCSTGLLLSVFVSCLQFQRKAERSE